MNSSNVGFVLSFLVGGTIVWIFLRLVFAKTKVPRTEFDQLNAAYRDSIVECVKLEERIAVMQERVEELNEKLLKAEQERSVGNDEKKSIRSTEIENTGQKFEEK